MPEMLAFCGQRFTVQKVANKACDTITRGGLRKMDDAVHLTAVRCDGSAHGGGQNGCLVYWEEAWLRRPDDAAEDSAGESAGESAATGSAAAARVTLPVLQAATRKEPAPDGTELYSCQATELNRATRPQPFLEVQQYVTDYRSG